MHSQRSWTTPRTGPAVVLLQGYGTVLRSAASDVTEAVVPHAGHWLMEEQPAATVKVVRAFLDART
jgi:pimeloyl-ACP methyl ester carboxylesterase